MRRILRQLVNESGAEIAEAAVVLPIVFMFLLGIVWFGRAFNIYSTITQAAQQGALAAARASCATCSPANTSLTDTQVDTVIVNVITASKLDASQIPSPGVTPTITSCPAPAPAGACTNTTHNITICRSVVLNPTGATDPPQCGATVSFQYPFQFYLPFTSLNQQRVLLSASAQTRMEN
jgi:Flp pilus assembly protein TadG